MSQSERLTAWAIFGVFFFESSVLGQWIPRIPDIKRALELSDAQLGLALFSLPVGTVFGLAIAGRVVEHLGLRKACQLTLPVWALLFILPAFSQNLIQLMLALTISGVSIGLIETAMNTEAARIENASGKRLMSRCHGFWSLGTMAGALLGGAIAHRGIGVSVHFAIILPIIAVAGYLVASRLPVLPVIAQPQSDEKASSGVIRLPSRAILLLCVMPLGVMMVEGAFIDWSAVFMDQVMDASPLLIAVTYSFFSIVMAVVRLSGDALANCFGERVIVQVSGLAASVGIALFALAPLQWVAFAGAAVAGAGVAIVFPLAVTAAANRPGRNPADNVAALNMIAFSAFLLAPPMIGFLSDWIGLRYALLSLSPLAFVTVLLSAQVNSITPRSDD